MITIISTYLIQPVEVLRQFQRRYLFEIFIESPRVRPKEHLSRGRSAIAESVEVTPVGHPDLTFSKEGPRTPVEELVLSFKNHKRLFFSIVPMRWRTTTWRRRLHPNAELVIGRCTWSQYLNGLAKNENNRMIRHNPSNCKSSLLMPSRDVALAFAEHHRANVAHTHSPAFTNLRDMMVARIQKVYLSRQRC